MDMRALIMGNHKLGRRILQDLGERGSHTGLFYDYVSIGKKIVRYNPFTDKSFFYHSDGIPFGKKKG